MLWCSLLIGEDCPFNKRIRWASEAKANFDYNVADVNITGNTIYIVLAHITYPNMSYAVSSGASPQLSDSSQMTQDSHPGTGQTRSGVFYN